MTKLACPQVLADNAKNWLTEYLAEPSSDTKKFRYRAKEIKDTLRTETHWKCVYCEAKIGHNAPGDIEHIVPSSKVPSRHFEWSNLTVACIECNRRKNDYYEKDAEFLNPYTDEVEVQLMHVGPFVYWQPGNQRAEVSVRTLELDGNQRAALIDRKLEALEKARALLDLVSSTSSGSPILRALRKDEARRMCDQSAEFSAMVRTYMADAESRLATRQKKTK